MTTLSADAADTVKLVRSLNLLDESSIRLLEQLFVSRLDEKLVKSLIGGKEELVAVTLFRLCTGAHTPHILGYALRFFADLVYVDRSLCEQLAKEELLDRFGDKPAKAFLQMVTTHAGQLGITNPALYLAAAALRYSSYHGNEGVFGAFFTMARSTFSAESLQVADVEFTVQACVLIARRKDLRCLFIEQEIIPFIPRLLTDIVSTDSASIMQLIYDTLLLTWLLSFEYEAIVQIVGERMIPQLHRVLQRVQKEKCLRMALSTLWNMVLAERKFIAHVIHHSQAEWVDESILVLANIQRGGSASQMRKGPALIAEMVGIGMLKTLAQLRRRKFGDEDISALIEELFAALEESMETLTSFSEYRGEVLSGSLEWTPVHGSAKFWKENAIHFEDNNYEVLTALGRIIMETRSNVTLAVACHDLGEVVRYHPTGRNLLTLPAMSGVKERIMSLMSSQDQGVAKEALLCTQKIMVQRWEYIQT